MGHPHPPIGNAPAPPSKPAPLRGWVVPKATTTDVSKSGVITRRTLAHGFHVIYNKCMRLAGEDKEHVNNTIKDIEFQTHIIRRQSLEVGLHCNRVPKT